MKKNLPFLQKYLSVLLLLLISAFGMGQVTQSFTYTGSNQTFTVPTGVTSITVKIWGAGGAGSSYSTSPYAGSGGSGAFLKGTLAVTPGSTLYFVVGGGGVYGSTSSSYGGGGSSGGSYGGSGGGYSGIFATSVSQANALALAGAGGGGGYNSGTTNGGAGGATSGSSGGNYSSSYTGGGGATTSAGGAGGQYSASGNARNGNSGTALQGGAGNSASTYTYRGGGGGGGYYGGGGGYSSGSSTYYSSGGGGGSSYYTSALTTVTNTAGTTNTSGLATQAPGNSEAEYVAGIGNGGAGTSGTSGGNGLIVITYTPPACSGTPTGGTVTVSPTSGVSGSTYGVSATGYTVASGITYQWQYNDGSGWNNQGSSSSTYSSLTGLTAPAYGTVRQWRLAVTCSNSSTTAYSSTGTFTTSYCTPTGTSTTYYISNVTTTGGITNISNSSGSNSGYGNFTAQSASNYPGASTNFSIIHTATSLGAGVGVWIDWNNNGVFTDANEQIAITSSYNLSPFTGTITVPASTPAGSYRMRIVIDYNSTSPSYCPSSITGETEDYTFTVVALPSCTTPNAPSSLTFPSVGFNSINGSFTASSPAPTGYIVVRSTSATPTVPTDGTTYTTGTSALGGTIVTGNASVVTATTFADSGLTPATTYYYYVYAYNSASCSGGPKYSAVLSGSKATASCGSYSGTMDVGASGTFTNLTDAVSKLTSCGYTGNIVLQLQSDYTSTGETFPITFSNTINGGATPTASTTITVKPATGVTPTISGANATAIFKLNGVNYLTIDGSNTSGGTTRDLTITNTNTSGAGILFMNGSSNNIVKNSKIYAVPSSSATYSGVVTIYTASATSGNNNNTIQNNAIAPPSTTLPYVGVYNSGTSTALQNTGNLIRGNDIYDFSLSGIFDGGFSSGAVYDGNNIYSVQTSTTNIFGIRMSATTIYSPVIKNNNIYGLKTSNTSTSGFSAGIHLYDIASGTTCNIYNNFISLSGGTTYPYYVYGIIDEVDSGQTANIYFNSINIYGNVTSASDYSYAYYKDFYGASVVKNNIFSNTRLNSSTGKQYAIAWDNYNYPGTLTSDYNDLYGTGNSYNFLGYYVASSGTASDNTTLSAWNSVTAKDTNSLNVLPPFVSNTNLHLTATGCDLLDSAGTPISGITTDIDADTRSATTPDIGADEFAGTAPPKITSVTGGSNCGTGSVSLSAVGTGTGFSWYTAATGGTSIGTGSPFATPSISTTTTYYVAATNGSCESSTRTAVVATINPAPTTPTITPATTSICPNTIQTLTAAGVTGNTTFINQTFTGSTAWPSGWSGVVVTGSDTVTVNASNNAGGTANEIDFHSNNGSTTSGLERAIYGPFNSSGYTSLALTWKNYLYHYSSSYSYYVKVQTSTDGVNWHDSSWGTNPVTATMAAGTQSTTLATSDVGSSTLYVAFTMGGLTFGVFDWYIDNVSLTGTTSATVTWSPITGLYTDATATTAYVANANATTVYFKSSTPGTTTYTTTATLGSCTKTATANVTVKTPVALASVTAATNPICSTATTTLTANGVVGDNAVVTWYTGSGGTGINLGTGVTSPAVGPGTYYARVTGDCGSPAEVSVTVGSKINVGITSATAGASTICSSSTTTLTANGVVGTNAVVTWYTGSGGSGTNLGTGVTSPAVGPGTYYARVTGDCGSPAEASVTVSTQNSVWDGASWSSAPASNKSIEFQGNYTSAGSGAGNIQACSCTVTSGNVTIANGDTMTLLDDIKVNGGSMTFENNAQLLQTNNVANTGNITSKKNAVMKRLDYTYWGSPVSGQMLKAFSPGTLNSRFYTYNEPDDTFVSVADPTTTPFAQGKGYAIRASNGAASTPATFYGAFTGLPNNGNLSLALAYTDATHGYNLVANPYPSNIDFDVLYSNNSSNIYQTAYFWTNTFPNPSSQGSSYLGDNYAIYSGLGGVSGASTTTVGGKTPTNIISVGQGFIVKSKNTGNLNFVNSVRTSTSTIFINKNVDVKDRYWVKLISPVGNVNTLLIGYVPNATNDYDLDYDAERLTIGSDAFYSVLNNKKLGIQARDYPLNTSDIVQLGTKQAENGNYTISLSDKDGVFANGQSIYLHDKTLGTYIDLQQGDYTFNAVQGESDNRFEITYKPGSTLGTNTNVKHGVRVYKSGEDVIIEADREFIEVKLYDASGRFIRTIKSGKKQLLIEKNKLISEINIFSIIFADETINKKVISN